jgi:threonylcarbamoyladenosine tRNA methylthiotransferase MtaB
MTDTGAAVRVVTLGCRLNAWESEVIRTEALAAGLDDTVIVNTCAVTGEAVRQARQTIRRLRRERPGSRIIVTGCAAQLAANEFAAMPEVDRVLGNTEKLDRRHLAADDIRAAVSDIMALRTTEGVPVDGFEGRTRAFVQIQQGCDHRCTFCIVPFARGPGRSEPPERVVRQVRTLVERGYAEIVLTGVDLCSYGRDGGEEPRLGDLVRHVLAEVPDLRRLRLSTLDPAAIDDALFRVLADEPRLMPHWHLSLQAADDMVLKRMRRRHGRAEAAAVVARARRLRPGIVLGADLIAGFPTEDETMFGNTLTAVDEFGLVFLHVFPYSPRPDTPAARMPLVPASVRRERAARLRAAGLTSRARYLSTRIGCLTDVLIESAGRGRGPDYVPVRVVGPSAVGTIVPARIRAVDGNGLVADAAS